MVGIGGDSYPPGVSSIAAQLIVGVSCPPYGGSDPGADNGGPGHGTLSACELVCMEVLGPRSTKDIGLILDVAATIAQLHCQAQHKARLSNDLLPYHLSPRTTSKRVDCCLGVTCGFQDGHVDQCGSDNLFISINTKGWVVVGLTEVVCPSTTLMPLPCTAVVVDGVCLSFTPFQGTRQVRKDHGPFSYSYFQVILQFLSQIQHIVSFLTLD